MSAYSNYSKATSKSKPFVAESNAYRKERDVKTIDLRKSSDHVLDSTDYETYLSQCVLCRFNEAQDGSRIFLDDIGLQMITKNSSA